MYSGIVA